MNNLLDKYKAAGVKSFTVRNGNAIADNPYEVFPENEGINHKWINVRNLRPLPTSGIPDGPVSIEEVEEQAYSSKERKIDFRLIPKTLRKEDKIYDDAIETVRVKREALRKGEEEKPERHKWSGAFISKRVDGGAAECTKCGCVKQYVNGIATYFINDNVFDKAPNCKPPQPEKMEQTAEGIDTIMSKYLPSCDCGEIYSSRGMTAPDCIKCNYLETVTEGAKEYAESQLAQYKEKVLSEAEAKKQQYIKYGRLAESTGVQETIDLIKNS